MGGLDPRAAAVLTVFMGILWGIFEFSSAIEAAFQPTLFAVLVSSTVLIGAGLFYLRNGTCPLLPLLTCSSIPIWPSWWPVLSSIANQKNNLGIGLAEEAEKLWWNADLFKWGIEAGLIILALFFLIRAVRNY